MVTTRSKTKKDQPRDALKREHSPEDECEESPESKQRKTFSGTSVADTRQPAQQHKLYTIGHGTRTLPDLISILESARITALADVRSIPQSRTNPQFNRNALASSPELREVGIQYRWLGKEIGGLRKAVHPDADRHTALRVPSFKNYAAYMGTPVFWEGLGKLAALVEEERGKGGGVAIMCSESVWWRCHRRMIADVLSVKDWEVDHLGIKKDPVKHVLWDIARLNSDGNLIYDGKA